MPPTIISYLLNRKPLVTVVYRSSFSLFLIVICGCAGKAPPAPDTGFLPDSQKLAPTPRRAPFNAVWYSDVDRLNKLKQEYHEVFVAPIRTEFLEGQIKSEDISEAEKTERINQLHEMAQYGRKRFEKYIREYPNTPLKIADVVGPKMFVLEIQAVELNPTNPILNAVGTIVGTKIPGASSLMKRMANGSIAIEAILRDGENGDILVEVKDREKDKSAPFTVRDYEHYGHARKTIDEWTNIFMELMTTPYEHKVTGLSPMTISPF